jgi:ABC-2 type transport system ATP-binding protein
VSAEPLQVGTVAAEHRIVLRDLRPDATALEDLFLELTSDTQRDVVPPLEGATA